jgi:hypothetical protein
LSSKWIIAILIITADQGQDGF